MPLKTIKLAGFKSFVDPTTIPLQQNLTAIVGPNGCGKSNIIDAVRWVLGEISAKQLRGESMSDVIFNGSTNRKPIHQAAVELIFDNSDMLLGGEYASYAEIAVRREVARDGISNYYLNNIPCLRKDIVGLFLGTGLGLHSYAIIEQGTISSLVEAKPEELRLHLEEAAGISKYKEKRRETETRMLRCQENLARLNDIRGEIDNQLKALKKQSNIALVYKKLREKERLLKAKLQVLSWQDLQHRIRDLQTALQNKEILCQEKLAKQREVEANIETIRQSKINLSDVYNKVQEDFYRLGASISQIEQRLHYNKERKLELTEEIKKLGEAHLEAEQHQVNDSAQIKLLKDELTGLTSVIEEGEKNFKEAEEVLRQAEQSMNAWHSQWEKFNEADSQISQSIKVAETQSEHLQKTIEQEAQLVVRFTKEIETLSATKPNDDIVLLSAKDQEAENELALRKEALAKLSESIISYRNNIQTISNELDQARNRLQELQGKKTALLALQKNSLHNDGEKIADWLKKNGLVDEARLAQKLKVVAGWEQAVEVVLGDYLEAISWDECLNLAELVPSLQNISGRALTFLFKDSAILPASSPHKFAATLASKVEADKSVADMLSHVLIAENLTEALKLRSALGVHESIVTRDGIWLSASWMRVALKVDMEKSVLYRAKELKRLEETISTEENACEKLKSNLNKTKEELTNLEAKQHQTQQEFHNFSASRNEVHNALSVKKAHLEHVAKQIEHFNREIHLHQNALVTAEKALLETKAAWQKYTLEKESNEKKRLSLSQERDQHRAHLDLSRGNLEKRKEVTTQHKMRFELIQKQIEHLEQNLVRAKTQLANFSEKQVALNKALLEVTEPVAALSSELEKQLEARLVLEKDLLNAKNKVQEAEHGWQGRERERAIRQEEVASIREELSALQVEKHGLEVSSDNHISQIIELGFELQGLIATMIEEYGEVVPDQQTFHDKMLQTTKRIDRLGPINLAAIDEYNKQKERKDYLDAQNADLLAALTTLENAMRKIDSETRIKLQTTFDLVNNNLKILFPKIFGGGRASLQLTTEGDLLDAGVVIWAQPPGKRNSTVHLLSGGEKALTAVALVFAIFQINPAPFCILDEVDAPFDDENVGRFCRLLQEMSPTVQFIYISHNKLSMETAHQLLGVTMQEPGVSRIVSVDIDSAMKMVE